MLKLNLNSKLQKNSLLTMNLICLVLLVIVFVRIYKPSSNVNKEGLNKFIVEKMVECKNQGENLCFRNIAHIFAAQYEINDVLEVFEENENNPIFFEKCHTALHFLGQEEYKIVKNTSKALVLGTPICFAGFYHGVLEAYLTQSGLINNYAGLVKIIPSLCGAQNSFTLKKNYNECLHGLGHALMFATKDELPASLQLCDTLSFPSDRNWCYSGSFMENSTSSTNKDHPSKYLKKDDPMYPCNILESKYGDMCYMLQSFYFAEISHYDWKQNEKLCKQVPAEFQDQCFNAIGQTQVGFTQDPNIMRDNCYILSERKNRTNCLNGIIGGLGERYNDGWSRVLAFCNDTVTEDDKNNCYNLAIELSGTWISDNKTLETFCSRINSDIARNQCRNRL